MVYKARLMIYYSRKYKIRFLAIPKNASTSVRLWLNIDLSLDWYETPAALANAQGQQFAREVLSWPLFAVVRNPIERWGSQYRYVKKLKGFPNFQAFLNQVRFHISEFGTAARLDAHLESQTRYLAYSNPKWVITMADLPEVFKGLTIMNATVRDETDLPMLPEDIRQYYSIDITNYNLINESKSQCKKLANYINQQTPPQ